MPTATTGDIEINYKVGGKGFPLVLIHGLGGSLENWNDRFVTSLEMAYCVIAFDNRGTGRTKNPGGRSISIEEMASDTLGLMEVLGLRKAHILGHSLGGMIALDLVLKHPRSVERLVLSSTSCGGLDCIVQGQDAAGGVSEVAGTIEEKACRHVSTLFPDQWLIENREHAMVLAQSYLEAVESNDDVPKQFMAGARFNSCHLLESVDCPALIACGTEDEVIAPRNSRILADRIPGARLIEYAGAGHGFIDEVPARFAREVIEFLGVPPGG